MNKANREEIETEVVQLLAKSLKMDPDSVQWDTPIAESGIDSLGLVEAVFVIEERFDISVAYNANDAGSGAFDAMLTVGDLLNQVVDLAVEASAESSQGLGVLPQG